jgi:hypothetical protein
MKAIGVALSICVVAATALATSAMPWAWEDTVITWLDQTDMRQVGANAPAIALDANRILTGALDEDNSAIFSEEATNGVRPEVWVHEEVFSDANVDDLWPPAFGLTTDWRQAVWCLKDNGATELVHKRGDLSESGWSDDTALLARNDGWPFEYSMATQGEEVFVVYTAVVYEQDYPWGLLALAKSSSEGEPGTWSTFTIKKVEDAFYGIPTVAVFKDGNNPCEVHVCYTDWDEGLKYIRSINGGTTWINEQVVDEDAEFYDLPCIQAGDWYNSTHDRHGLFLTWGADPPMLTFSSDNGESWGGLRYALPQNRVGVEEGVEWPRMSVFKRGANDFRLALTAPVGSPWPGHNYTYTIAHVGNGLGCIREWLSEKSGAFEYSCVGDKSPTAPYTPRLRTTYVTHPDNADLLAYQGAEYTFDLWPVAIYPTIRGPGRLIASDHDPVQPGVQGVSEANPCGDTFVCYHGGLGDTSGWDVIALGHSPALAADENGRPWVVFERHDSLFSIVSASDTAWSCQTVFAAPSSQHLGPPSLAVFQNGSDRIGNVCFPCYDTVTAGSMILFCQFDTTSGAWSKVLDTLDYCNGKYTDSSACLTVCASDTISVCYNSGDSVYARRLVYVPNSTCRPGAWSSATLVDSNVASYHASCEKIDSRLWIAYTRRTISGNDTTWAIMRTSCLDTGTATTWEGTTAIGQDDEHRKDYPSISTSAVVAWAESSGTHWVIKASVDDSVLTLTSPDSNSKFVSILADTSVQTTPSTSTTGVYFTWRQQQAGDTWAVNYASKQILTSNAEANVTRYNQGRKLTLDGNDTLHSVYRTDAGSVVYAKKKDGVEGWTSSLLRSTGQFPCLANDYLNRTWVADHDVNSVPPSQVIRCQNRAAGSSTWHDFQVYSVSTAGPANAKIGPPSIVACQNDSSNTGKSAAYIVFTVYSSSPLKSAVVLVKVCTTGVVYVDTLYSVTTYGDSFPSIAAYPVSGPGYGLEVAWQYGTDVYVKKTTNSEHPEFLLKRTWSSNFNLSNTAARSKHPVVAADADTVLVAWVEGDSGAVLTKGQGPGSAYNAWDASVCVSACTDSVTDNPSIGLGDSIVVTYQKKLSSTNYDIIARVNFHSNLNLSNSTTTSKYPHCVFHFHDGDPVITTVWTEELSANYAEVAYKRWQLGEEDGGGIQDFSIFDPNIHPALFAPAPNPFNGLTNIRYQTNIKGLTRITVMDITGRRVRNLLTMPQSPGIYNLTWNAKDDRERQLPRGVYFVRLETTNYSEARKLILTE